MANLKFTIEDCDAPQVTFSFTVSNEDSALYKAPFEAINTYYKQAKNVISDSLTCQRVVEIAEEYGLLDLIKERNFNCNEPSVLAALCEVESFLSELIYGEPDLHLRTYDDRVELFTQFNQPEEFSFIDYQEIDEILTQACDSSSLLRSVFDKTVQQDADAFINSVYNNYVATCVIKLLAYARQNQFYKTVYLDH